MIRLSRRQALQSLLAAAGAGAHIGAAAAPVATRSAKGTAARPRCHGEFSELRWARGIEGQRRADLGNGTFLNPILAGDHPDPSILRDGDDYYMTCSSFDAYPGVVIWHSRDLVNWQPTAPALHKPIGSVWACDLCKYDGRYYVYIPARTPARRSIYVIHANDIRGPWSEPIDLDLPDHIDPGHAVGEDGKRYLFLSNGDRVQLSDDGLTRVGEVQHLYDAWRYPEDWDVESFSPEGPKISRRGVWFYLITAVGGTAGPPTGHMVIAARSRSIHGPWESCPHNPIVRTWSRDEKWWSRGHATLVEGPGAKWWLVYHGYENGLWTLGRQTLLDPVEWTDDDWFVARGGDLSQPIPAATLGHAAAHGMALSDSFGGDTLGMQWSFYDPAQGEHARLSLAKGCLQIAGKGTTPADCSPLSFIAGDLAYEVEVDVEIDDGACGGLLLFYNRRLYCGVGVDERGLVLHRYGLERGVAGLPSATRRLRLRVKNERHVVTFHYRPHDGAWTRFPVQMEVSGYHHNVSGDFLSLRPALYAARSGSTRFRTLTYRALPA